MEPDTNDQVTQYQPRFDWILPKEDWFIDTILDSRPITKLHQLYHYTNAEGLVGIDNALELWATDLRYVNDASELQEASDLFLNELRINAANFPVPMHGIATWLENFIADKREYPAYAFSLSEHGDDLGQWRGYCPNGRGYSLCFDMASFVVNAPNGWRLLPCVYDTKTQKDLMGMLISEAVLYANRQLQAGAPISHARGDICVGLLLQFWRIAPFIKNAAFREEREWRLALPATTNSRSMAKYRVRNGTLVPYIPFPLTVSERLVYNVKELIVGPTHHRDFGLSAAEGFKQVSKLGIEKVLPSKIPYQII